MIARFLINRLCEGGEFPRKHRERALHVKLPGGQLQCGEDGKPTPYKTLKAAREAAKSCGGGVTGWNYAKGRHVELRK